MIASTLSSRCLRRGLATNASFLSVSYAPARSLLATATRSALPVRRNAANESTNATARNGASSSAAIAGSEAGGGGGGGGTAGKLFFSSLCLLTFGLGTWQTRRYFEKVEMTRKREDDLTMDPLSDMDAWRTSKDAAANEANAKTKSYRRVHLRGRFRHDNEILVGPRGPPPGALAESGPNSGRGGGGGMSSSAQGYWVITPLVVSDGDDDATVRPTKDFEVEEEVPKRRWMGRYWGKTREPSETSTVDINSDASIALDSSESDNNQTVVWINRGWIPRHYITNHNEITTPWHRPQGAVRLTAMESDTETPRTFSPPSRLDSKEMRRTNDDGTTTNNSKKVDKLLWMDRQAMEEIMATSSRGTNGDPSSCHPPLFVEIDSGEGKSEGGGPPIFPVKPSREFVGEFKVTPSIHAGYAFTWFGLSGAGMVMTRKLLRRGR